MPKKLTHRNHYLPQKYQFGFANKENRIWIYDRVHKAFRKGTPLNTGIENDFYTTVDKDGAENDAVEKLLATLEGATWPAIDMLESRVERLDITDRVHLSLFIALMKTRVPAFDKQQSHLTESLVRWTAKMRARSPDVIAEFAKSVGKPIDDERAKRVFESIHEDGFGIEVPRQNNIKGMLELSISIGRELVSMDWTVLHIDSEDNSFITSDNPFILLPPTNLDSSTFGFGILTPGAASIIPLSRKIALCMRPTQGESLRHERAPKDFVRFINAQVAANSDRIIIGKDEALLRKLVKITKADQWRNDFKVAMHSSGTTCAEPGIQTADSG